MSRDSAREHVADPPMTGGAREMTGSQDRVYSSRTLNFGRFRWAVVALFVIAACSLAAAVALTTGRRHSTGSGQLAGGQGWSTWQPPDGGLAGAQEIADFLAPNYRATPASQLAVVTVVNLADPTVQVVIPTGTGGALPLPAGSTVVYNLCGEDSSNCAIGVGKPSPSRLLLLRREALELALYTFRYIAGAQTVVAILPPGITVQRCTGTLVVCAKPQQKSVTKPLDLAVAFARGELSTWLARPLRATLPESIPPTVSKIAKSREAELVSLVTAHGLFTESTAAAQDGSTLISLAGPVEPQ
jgi:hypothetical protein